MTGKRMPSYSKARLRNLPQYKNLSEEELDKLIETKKVSVGHNVDFEQRIAKRLEEFSNDYDIENLKINDMLTLRALAQAYITLEDYERVFFELRRDGVGLDSILQFKNLSDIMSTLRSDISKMQTDLGISRKARKSERDDNVISELERLKTAAREFYEQKLFYIFCPKCNTLLSTTWFLYPEDRDNKLTFICKSKPDGDNICGHKFTITSKELLDKKGINSNIIPDGLR